MAPQPQDKRCRGGERAKTGTVYLVEEISMDEEKAAGGGGPRHDKNCGGGGKEEDCEDA